MIYTLLLYLVGIILYPVYGLVGTIFTLVGYLRDFEISIWVKLAIVLGFPIAYVYVYLRKMFDGIVFMITNYGQARALIGNMLSARKSQSSESEESVEAEMKSFDGTWGKEKELVRGK